ncbi:DUF262 domain-containing HNH endonuclease family protein [Kitasatospora purpeofusca]|uniref:DUF262 domain-containing HNH endonuclease family protein n=1 Tax=Kitasatospora purpeofusca TaxID=67352 RepID=UPI000AEA469B|nr:DUF262 domain-containing HNH endonuclease family protein [Kitasatospora purpeofusca]
MHGSFILETREIFDAAPYTVAQFLSETGQCLYIPPYQRAYSWDANKVKRLIADVAHGVEQLTKFQASICFIGSVIALRDLEYTTVDPIHRPMVPPRVMSIIDGQQRMTTLLLLTTVLHEEITTRANRLPKGGGEARDWCFNQAVDVTVRLTDTFEEDMRYGEGEFRFYPRMIRSYHDVWSRNKGEAQYESPIGYYLHQYAQYGRSQIGTQEYKHTPFLEGEAKDANAQAHKHLEGTRVIIRRALRQAVSPQRQAKEDEAELISAVAMAESKVLQEALFNSPFPEFVMEAAREDERIAALLRLIVFANYLLNRVTVAVVTSKHEDYGFDMFEALNTTGQPLTAIETFKPKAIKNEPVKEWHTSESYGHFDTIEKYLDAQGASSADKRQTATDNILIPFALLNDGYRLSKRLSEQRRYLRTSFDKEAGQAEKRVFLQALAQLTKFVSGPWADPSKLPECSDAELRNQAALCAQVLTEAKHNIVIAPLTRYYAAHRLEQDDIDGRAREFLTAVRACGAFFGLWRGAFGGTNGIDKVYRDLMDEPSASVDGLRFKRLGRPLTEVPPVEDMLSFLRQQLQEAGLAEKDRWVAKASEITVYKSSNQLTKLLLLAASNDSTPDQEKRGLIALGRRGLLSTLNLESWHDQAFSTIEHVAPQKTAPGWDAKLYDDNVVDVLGNLTLLPGVENSSAKQRPWPIKRLMFQALSATTVEEAERTLAQAAQEGIEIGDGAEAIIRRARHLPLVAALAQREEDWTVEFVQERSKRLCGMAWDSLAPWLGL